MPAAGTLNINNSKINANVASGTGGGVYSTTYSSNPSTAINIVNSSITNNSVGNGYDGTGGGNFFARHVECHQLDDQQ